MLDHFISPENILRLAHNTPDHIQILLTLNRVRLSHRFGVAQSRCTPIARAHRNRSQPRTPQLPWNCRLTPRGQHNGRTRAAAANTHTPSISRDNPHPRCTQCQTGTCSVTLTTGTPVASVLTELALECSVPSSAQLLSGTGVSSALQCLAFRWHFSAPVPQCLTVTVTRSPNLGWERAGNAKKCVY